MGCILYALLFLLWGGKSSLPRLPFRVDVFFRERLKGAWKSGRLDCTYVYSCWSISGREGESINNVVVLLNPFRVERWQKGGGMLYLVATNNQNTHKIITANISKLIIIYMTAQSVLK